MSEKASRDHAPAIGSALDWADAVIRAYAMATALVFLWALFTKPHGFDTRAIIGAFAVAVLYSAWPQPSSAKQPPVTDPGMNNQSPPKA